MAVRALAALTPCGVARLLLGFDLISTAAAGLAGPLLTRLRGPLLGVGIGAGRSDTRLTGLLSAALGATAGVRARRLALRIGLLRVDAGRIGRILLLLRLALACLAGFLVPRLVAFLRRGRAGIVTRRLAGPGRRLRLTFAAAARLIGVCAGLLLIAGLLPVC